jgi:Fe2+ or Zn2+ uptake regulation protein
MGWRDLESIRPGRLVGEQPANEADHFFVCEACGQAVDMRNLAEVFRHEEDPHEARKPS